MKASTFDEWSSSSVLWAINTVPEHFTSLRGFSDHTFDNTAVLMILMSIQLGREAASLCPEGHTDRAYYLHNLAFSLTYRFDHQGKPNDLDEAISLYEEGCACALLGTNIVIPHWTT
ncbi:uncharacterized protein BJ212DRAFT_995509 [Suillus subaureus]|uniref:Uncharacterized protein n=1 Tax=Suillus subaureus TaxID=48587 RepID=A0A9P7J571_9AGAM|nr:uncharacterized protein BJ212DRAFT_995509 [Suillus subaureus]KAG1803015.1 hypothetical protein BJ212DRAFT_995509 [Suillus subaureus]